MAFSIVRNDITEVAADAIVNTANPKPLFGSGTDAAVYKKAGIKELLKERKKIGKMEVGEAKATPAFSLPAKHIIHTVGPVWKDGKSGEEEDLRRCYKNCLALASRLGCESVAFPLISTGSYGFPKADALRIMISEFSEFLAEHEMEITLVVFDGESFALSGKIFSGIDEFIDEKYVSEKMEEEYADSGNTRPVLGMTAGNVAVKKPKLRLKETGSSEKRPFGKKRTGKILSDSAALPPDFTEGVCEEDICESCVTFDKPRFEEPAKEVFRKEAKSEEEFTLSFPKKERSLDELMSQMKETWQENLFRLIDEKGYSDTEVYKRANVDRKLFSKIRSNPAYQPKKSTAIAFALAMRLNLDETKDFLSRAGFALSPSSKADLIVEYFIEKKEYDIYVINLALFDHQQPLLGA